MKVLVACEFSGIVRDAFIAKGHDAISCDLLSTERPGPHIQGDVSRISRIYQYDMLIAHPPCTRLCNSGVMWLKKRNLWDDMKKACEFFLCLKNAPVEKVCVENPIPHGYARQWIGEYDQIVQPWMFGHMERKATCLWLKGLPKLIETDNVREAMLNLPKNEQQRLHYLPPSENRARLRSTTFQGIADAMADQWG